MNRVLIPPSLSGDPADILARTLWGEARGEGSIGMAAVANVIQNRVENLGWWGHDVVSVCLMPWQFSCWNAADPNRAKLLAVTDEDPQFVTALIIAKQALAGDLPDLTEGSTTYKTKWLAWPASWGAPVPARVCIGNHAFYNLAQEHQPTQKGIPA